MSKKTKVVYIVEAMLGGIRQHVIDIIENLDQDQYEIYLIYSDTRADKAFFCEKEKLNSCAKLILCNEMQRELGRQDISAYKAIKAHLTDISPDIVHCHSSKAGIVGRLAAKRCGVKKIIYTPNAYAFETPDISYIKKHIYVLAERYLSRHATNMTINVSKGELYLARKYKLDRDEKFTLIYNGIPDIELPSKEELRRELGLRADIFYVGVTARCARQKDPMTFLAIAERIVCNRDDVEFLYIGDGEMYDQMKKYVVSHGLEKKVHLWGYRSDACRIVGVLDVYLSTALYEGLPYSMIEAMRADVPIVATNTVGNNELVFDGKNGELFPVGNVDDAVEILQDLENIRLLEGQTKVLYSEKFSLKSMIRGLLYVYDGVIKNE